MSTQSASSIPFTYRFPQQAFKLLELPPELADLLSSQDAPILELKSPSPSNTANDTTETDTDTNTPAYLNLCTPTQTYRVRQVQSSNSLHLLTPGRGAIQKRDSRIVGEQAAETNNDNNNNNKNGEEEEEDDDDDDDDDDNTFNQTDPVTSIAKCGSTLELDTPVAGFSAAPRTTTLPEDLDPSARRDAIERVFDDIPVSRRQCEAGWVDACAFLLGAPSVTGWVPSAQVKLAVWKRLLEGSVLHGIDLGKQFLVRDLWRSVLDEDGGDEPFPRPLFEAVVRRVCESGGQKGNAFESEMKWASIDKSICVQWVGETCLEAEAPTAGSAVDQTAYLNAWKDHLPETWRGDVSLSKLPENYYLHPEPKTICFATETDRQKVKKNLPTDTSAAVAAKKSRNWHELFKNQKRQKR
ncbi:hypothetical protein ARAM_001260 [Aspergillus rambellii]|uniref:Sister chromatid cohesion protein Dcc1 n=1 Tax=Aspergillus rambellii TaxID=308745 RepID=A0A0F8VDX1_9EURO|nr:hypothetical protein ARAM_001260 [Aspergillus rambellii]